MIETEFWKVVEAAEDPVEVLYGADIDTTITGSGFPQKVCLCLPSALPACPKTQGPARYHSESHCHTLHISHQRKVQLIQAHYPKPLIQGCVTTKTSGAKMKS